MKRNVYVTNFSGVDTSDAHKFLEGGGEVINITEGTVNIFNQDSLMRNIMYQLRNVTADDFLVLAGNSTVAVYCAMYILSKIGEVQLLIWNNREGSYNLQKFE